MNKMHSDHPLNGPIPGRILPILTLLAIAAAAAHAQIQTSSPTTPASGSGLSPLTPPSTNQQTLVPTRPESPDQNLVITGNVPGGRHFRGPVPYGSPHSLGAGPRVAAPSPVDSFLRRSAPPPDRTAPGARPYYDPRTIAGSRLNDPLIGSAAPSAWQSQPHTHTESSHLTATGIYRPRSMLSVSAAEMQRLSGIDILADSVRLPTESLLQHNLTIDPPGTRPDDPVTRPAGPVARQLTVIPAQSLPPTQSGAQIQHLPAQPESPVQTETDQLQSLIERDIASFDHTRRQLKPADPARDEWPVSPDQQDRDADTRSHPSDDPDLDPRPEPAAPDPALDAPVPQIPPLARDEQQVVRGMLHEHKTYKELASAKVKEFTAAGDTLLKEGRYYKAVDAYVLALIWDPRNAQVNLRRAIAHFGAGEFVSAGHFLERAIALNPDYAWDKFDLTGYLPNRDVIDHRLLEGADWQKETGSGEIAVILAWVYQQQGRSSLAAEYLNIARRQLPDSPALDALQKAHADQ